MSWQNVAFWALLLSALAFDHWLEAQPHAPQSAPVVAPAPVNGPAPMPVRSA